MRRWTVPWTRALGALGVVFATSCGAGVPAPDWHEIAVVRGAPSYAFPASPAFEVAAPAPPLSLTASDGTGLRLAEMDARAMIEEPLAFTELHLVFDNPEDRRLEGTFSITLPEGAALSRFAMKVGDAWQEGEVVEKQRARRAYEDFLHKRQDPALLEQAAGNQFTARVFPIPARGRKELIVSYSQEIPSGRPYALPLRGLPRLGRLAVSVLVAGESTPASQSEQTEVTPSADFQLDPRFLRAGGGLRSGELVLARVRPIPAAEPDPLASTVVLVDTSASRALGFEEQIQLVGRLARRIAATAGAATPLAVGAFDQTAETIFEGDAGSFGDGDLKRLRERQAFGASSLEGALAWAEARARGRGYKRVIVVGDGVATAGETAAGTLGGRAARLRAVGVERLDAIAVGGIRDEAMLRRLATAGLPRDGVVADGGLEPAALERKLTLATRSGIPVTIEGARWQWPTVLDGVQAGDEVLVYADVPEGQAVRVSLGGRTGEALDLAPVERPLLERSWARAKITALVDRIGDAGLKGDAPDESIVRQVIDLSTRLRVLSPYTSLLVLETEADFSRFGLDRKALADILTVDRGRVAVAQRSTPAFGATASTGPRPAQDDAHAAVINPRPLAALPPPPEPPPPPPAPAPSAPPPPRPAQEMPSLPPPTKVASQPFAPEPRSAQGNMWSERHGDALGASGLAGIGEGGGGHGEGIGLGSVGTLGHGAGSGSGQGFGSGGGRLGGAHATEPPRVRVGAVQVSGHVPAELIQRIVRQNFGRFRLCYESGLRRAPDLQGRISVRFTIQRDGSVADASVVASEIGPEVPTCIARAMYGLSFPAPDGGSVTIVYPFKLGPDGPPTRNVEMARLDVPRPAVPVAPLPALEPPPPPLPRASAEPYSGRFKTVMDLVGAGGARTAIDIAYAWHREAPGDVMALVALGEALEGGRETAAAARVYGSIVDLFPARADLRRFAGRRLERLGAAGIDEAIDTFTKAEEERPDHPEGHRLVAFARLRQGDFAGAFAAAERGRTQSYPSGRFRGVAQILREDLGLIAAAWIKAEPARREDILARLDEVGGRREDEPSLRFVLSWETDANDVDFHIHDAHGGHAYYRQPTLPSGGELYADVTTGYGPECFTIRLPRESRSEMYRLEAHYFSRGPMGYGMGKLEIIDHDGKGGLTFTERPFVVMADGAYVDLGTILR